MGTAARRDMTDKEVKKVPGPGNYENKGGLAESGMKRGFTMGAKVDG